MALHAIVYFNAGRFIRAWSAVGALVAMDAVLVPMMLARPHLLVWPLIALWTWLMLRARQRERAPPLPAALLMVIWTNLHGSYVLGLLIAGAFGLEALIASPDRWRAFRQWLAFGLACVVAACINANGVEGVFHPLLIAKLSHLRLIDEWKPSNPKVTPFFFVVFVGVLLLIWRKRPQLSAVRWGLLAALLALAFYQVRHQPVLAIVAAMLLPAGFAKAETAERTPPNIKWFALAGMAGILIARAILPVTLPDNEANPWKLIATIPPELRNQAVLNGHPMGGPLILSGIKPYIDGRTDMYGDEFVLDYKRITEGDPRALSAAVKRWNIRWAILPKRYAKLLALMDNSPEWRRIHADLVGVIYVRN